MTRSVIIFRDSDGRVVLVIYCNHDGYPEGFGRQLAEMLNDAESTGFGCMAAMAVPILLLSEMPDDVDSNDDESDFSPSVYFDRDLIPCRPMEQLVLDMCSFVYVVDEVPSSPGGVTVRVLEGPPWVAEAKDPLSLPDFCALCGHTYGKRAYDVADAVDLLWSCPRALLEDIEALPLPAVVAGSTTKVALRIDGHYDDADDNPTENALSGQRAAANPALKPWPVATPLC